MVWDCKACASRFADCFLKRFNAREQDWIDSMGNKTGVGKELSMHLTSWVSCAPQDLSRAQRKQAREKEVLTSIVPVARGNESAMQSAIAQRALD
eukprot:6186393-Amphidinium_carterae.1